MTNSTSRPVIYGTQGVISSGHYLTSMAGMRMLLSGGNAFDAIVAAGFAAAVTEPIASYSLGAEGVFMLYHADSGDLLSLSGQGTAPNRATVEWYRDQGYEAIPTGPGPDAHLSFTVPGVVAAFLSLLERYGTKSVEEALAPSIQYAGEGIPNYEYMLQSIGNENTKKQWAQYPPGGSDVFYDNGAVPEPGSLLVQPGMAGTLKKLVKAERAAEGDRAEGVRAARECFYEGEVARTIAECSKRVGGILDMDTLADYEAQYETPIKTSFLGHEVHGQRTWTQGAVLMQSLNILENVDLRSMGHNSTAYIHTVSQALNLAFADRQTYYGDPDFADVPIEGLLSKDYARERVKLIDPGRAFPETPDPGDPWRYYKVSPVSVRRCPKDKGGCRFRCREQRRSWHHAYLRHRRRRQHGRGHALWWFVLKIGLLPRTRIRAQHEDGDAQFRRWSRKPARTGQASEDYPDQLYRV